MNRLFKSNVPVAAKHLDPKLLLFSVFTVNDIRNLSVTKISTPLSFNILGHALRGGLYDPALGPLNESTDICATCNCNVLKCPGHFGHIDLPIPVVNPLFHKMLYTLIKLSCLSCFKLQIPAHIKLLTCAKLRLLREGFLSDLDELEQEVMCFVNSAQEIQEGEIVYIQEIIESFIQNLYNRDRFNPNNSLHKENNFNIKNVNVQWHTYIENTIKHCTVGKVCIHCDEPIPKVTAIKNKILTTKSANRLNSDGSKGSPGIVYKLQTVPIMPDQSKEYLRKLWQNESNFLKVIVPCLQVTNVEFPTDIFFFETIPVLPPIARPINFVNGQMIEHPQSQVYKCIIQDCLVLKNIIQMMQDGDTRNLPEEGKLVFEQIRGKSPVEKLHNAWQSLQANANHLMDRELSKTTDSANCQGLKQTIEKKEGIIRMHMMGKRVNFAARSVITPDPNLNIDEVGVPEAFALKLTYPVAVTPWNVAELRQMVLNGPDVYPGAVMVESEDGFINRIDAKNTVQKEAIAKRLLTTSGKANRFFYGVKIVHRHLLNGDILLLNRQPTLHKPSIMAHKARILKGEKTLRLHYANCKAYNADFDGDEMNAHFPQNEVARSEGYYIANVSNQYLVPKDGTPLSGLIQDHMISGVRLTVRGQFFSKEDYMQLVYSGLSDVQGNLILLPPAIIKPVPLWSGKQVISTVIINVIPRGQALINMTGRAKIGLKEWQVRKPRRWKCGIEFENSITMSETEVVIRNGELLCGVLDKNHYGATPYGLVHCIFELYGGSCSSKMLSAFGKLFQAFLQINGFTLGIEDILIMSNVDVKRTNIIRKCRMAGEEIQRSALELSENVPTDVVNNKIEEKYSEDSKFRANIDRKYKTALDVFTNDINKTCLPSGLLKKFPNNNLQLMVQSGAKGSTVNTMQISCLLGQIELEGKRPPLMISGKSLPSFPAFDPSPRSGGFIDGRFMTGIQPQEFFFHCMAGREGLIDTAVKTSRSGYLQRCLIKHLEGLVIGYDSTVRDSDGSVIQFLYGEDGLDVLLSRFLRKEQIEFLADNRNAIVDQDLLNYTKNDSQVQTILKQVKKLHRWINKNGNALEKGHNTGFIKFCMENSNAGSSKHKHIDHSNGRSRAATSIMKKWMKLDDETKNGFKSQCTRCPDPITSRYRQDLEYGVLSERIENLIGEYMKERNNKLSSMNKHELRDLLCVKTIKSLCLPGEPVGLLAAQSIGEPSTQMTLNTFHFAGRGEMNVTLGIPRLREILMMASKNIKTPSMEIPFKADLHNVAKKSNRIKLKLTKCVLSSVLKSIKVDRKTEEWPQRQLMYTLAIEFLPHKSYKGEFCVQPKHVVQQMEKHFLKELFKEIKRAGKIAGTLIHFEGETRRNGDEDARLDEDDADGDVTKSQARFDLGEMHESSDEDEAADDADATVARTMSRHQENQEYEDPEEEEEEEQDEVEEIAIENDEEKTMPDAEGAERDKITQELENIKYEERKKNVVNMYTNVLEYDYDKDNYLSCNIKFWLPLKMLNLDLSTIIRTAADKVVLWETPSIKRAFVFQNNNGETILKTDGFNILEMFKYNKVLDLRRLYSNDIYGVSQTYGIEATHRVIVKEVKDVFKMYGITIDTRHLLLIADYMTFDGKFQPLSRKGMENSASPLQQMSFESSLNFLKNATLQGKQDNLVSPSSRLMLGQPCRSGTGAFSILMKMPANLDK